MMESRRPRTRIRPSFRCGRSKSTTTATNRFPAFGQARTVAGAIVRNPREIKELQPSVEMVNTLVNPGNEIAQLHHASVQDVRPSTV